MATQNALSLHSPKLRDLPRCHDISTVQYGWSAWPSKWLGKAFRGPADLPISVDGVAFVKPHLNQNLQIRKDNSQIRKNKSQIRKDESQIRKDN